MSGVIPAYNAEHSVAAAIQSVLDQTYKIDEVIVVDDGSSDDTANIASRFPRTRVIRQPNVGPGAARNTGIHAASGDWVAFLDADDIWEPQKTEVQVRCIAPDVGIIHANRFDPIHFGSLWHRQAHVTPSGVLARKQTLLDVGGFENSRRVSDDLTLWLKIALTDWRFVRSDGELFQYRPTKQSLSADDLSMAQMELATLELMGKRVNCPSEGIVRVKRASRIEYAKNLIANKQWAAAGQLLGDCAPGFASRWLRLVSTLRVRRLARSSIVRWLQTADQGRNTRTCSGECGLLSIRRKQCMECHTRPYFRPI